MGLKKTLQSILAIGPTNYVKTKRRPHGEIIEVQIGGRNIAIRARTTDLSVAIDSLLEEYEPLAGLLPPDFDGLIVDAGAYIGTASIRLSELYPSATIVAIEPSSRNFQVLEMNTQQNNRIHREKAALSTVTGEYVGLYDGNEREWGFTIVQGDASKGNRERIEQVPTTTLAEIEKKFSSRIGLLKLDIEGEERSLFSKADKTLSRIPVIFVELHERSVPNCEKAFREFSQERTVKMGKGEKYLSIAKH